MKNSVELEFDSVYLILIPIMLLGCIMCCATCKVVERDEGFPTLCVDINELEDR